MRNEAFAPSDKKSGVIEICFLFSVLYRVQSLASFSRRFNPTLPSWIGQGAVGALRNFCYMTMYGGCGPYFWLWCRGGEYAYVDPYLHIHRGLPECTFQSFVVDCLAITSTYWLRCRLSQTQCMEVICFMEGLKVWPPRLNTFWQDSDSLKENGGSIVWYLKPTCALKTAR